MFKGQFRVTWRFYRLCDALAYRKHKLASEGETGEKDVMKIEELRGEIRKLSELAAVKE